MQMLEPYRFWSSLFVIGRRILYRYFEQVFLSIQISGMSLILNMLLVILRNRKHI